MITKIGSTAGLEEKPLTRWFMHTEEGYASGVEVVYAASSELSQMLVTGEISAALAPSFEIFRKPGYAVVPKISISTQGAAESIRAFARVPWRKIESLALDTASATSAALLQILLAEQLDSHPALLHSAPGLEAMSAQADACLLTGDEGLLADGRGLNVLDLGHAWRLLTGLPFVSAVWLGQAENITPHLVQALTTAKAWGLTQTEVIAAEEAQRIGTTASRCRHYYTEVLDYDLGGEHLRALEVFGRKARTHQLLPAWPDPIQIAGAGG